MPFDLIIRGLGYDSVTEHLPDICKVSRGLSIYKIKFTLSVLAHMQPHIFKIYLNLAKDTSVLVRVL